MQARFNFAGTLIPPNEDLPTHLGLHHHGEEPEVRDVSHLLQTEAANVPRLAPATVVVIPDFCCCCCCSVQVIPCRNSSCCPAVSSTSRGCWPSALWPTSCQRYTPTPARAPCRMCEVSPLHHPVGTCRRLRLCSEGQRCVHAAGRRPGLPAALWP